MPIFSGDDAHSPYLQWLLDNSHGYVLQINDQGIRTLHRATCRHIGAGGVPPVEGKIWTRFPKHCSDSRDYLLELASVHCEHCLP